MKRLSFLLCLLSVISLSACSEKNETPPVSSSSNANISVGVGEDSEETQNSAINIKVKEAATQ